MAIDIDEQQRTMHRAFLERFRDGGRFSAVNADMVRDFESSVADACIPASLCQFWLHFGCGEVPALAATAKIFPRPSNAPPPFARLLSPIEVRQAMSTPAYAFIPAWVRYDGDDELFPDQERRADIERDDAWKYILPIATDATRADRWICMLRHYNIECDLPIYQFDPAADSIAEIAPGFDALLQAYLRLPKVE